MDCSNDKAASRFWIGGYPKGTVTEAGMKPDMKLVTSMMKWKVSVQDIIKFARNEPQSDEKRDAIIWMMDEVYGEGTV